MSRRALRRDDSTVSLFPFLAVLICTMGALIVLLVVVVQQATVPESAASIAPTKDTVSESTEDIAVDPAPLPKVAVPLPPSHERRDPQGPALATLEQEFEAAKQQVGALESSRARSLQELREHQLTLSRIEDRTRSLAERLEQLRDEARQIAVAHQSQVADSDTAHLQLERLQRAIAAKSQELDEARREAAEHRQLYAIVPYDGPNGTERRPVYLECLADRVILQPEGIEFYADDFAMELGPDNPLAASLRAVREHLLDAGVTSSSTDAYPLLIVRPEGARAYAACRRALQGWDDEFGYELVPTQMKLKYHDPDPALALVVQEVVERSRQMARFIARRSPQPNGELLLSANSRTGGFVTQQGEQAGLYASHGSHQGNGHEGQGSGSAGQPPNGAVAAGRGDLNNLVPPPNSMEGTATSTWNPGQAGGWSSTGSATAGDRGLHAGAQANAGMSGGGTASAAGGPTAYGGDSIYASRSLNGGDGNGHARAPGGGDLSQYASQTTATPGGTGGDGSRHHSGTRQAAAAGTTAPTDAVGMHTAGSGAAGAAGVTANNGPGSPNVSPGGPGQTGTTPQVAFGGGSNWGLPNANHGAIGITRPVYLTCTADAITLRPAQGAPLSIPFDGATQSAIHPLITMLWQHIETWGIAGNGVYWKPILKVDVSPDGETRFSEFASLLHNSGLEVLRR